MEELMALLRTIAEGVRDDEARHAAMESVEDYGKALNRKPAEAQAPAEAEREDAEAEAFEEFMERVRFPMVDMLDTIRIRTVSSDVEEIGKLAEAACGIVTTLHLAGLLGRG